MTQHPLLDILQQFKEDIRLEGNPPQFVALLTHIDSYSTSLIRENDSLQQELAQQKTDLKQLSKKLRKTNSKLTKKTEECEGLKSELQRVHDMHSLKVKKLLKTQERGEKHDEEGKEGKQKNKRITHLSSEIQCQILSDLTIKELSAQNYYLKERLEEAQKVSIQTKNINRDLSLRLEVMNVLDQDNDIIKDNSTLDGQSMRGEPFQDEESEQWQKEPLLQNQMKDTPKEGWLNCIWRQTSNLYQSLIRKGSL